MRFSKITLAGLLLAVATPAMAQDEEPAPPVTVTGGVTAITDYRFRGLTQSDEGAALQATLNVNHESGFYAGTWVSTIDNVTSLPGYGGAEMDLYAGFTKSFDSGFGFDVGLLYYYYPNGTNAFDTDFFEPYASVMYTVGPVTAKVGANYAWDQGGLAGNDSLYLRGDLTVAIPGTPVSALAHIGHTDGQLGFLAGPDMEYYDWSLGLEAAHEFVKLGVQYVDTDITDTAGYASTIGADATFLAYLTLSF